MPCQLPGNKAVLSEEAEFRDSERQKVIDRAAKLHREGLSNAVIMQRLGITRPTLVDYLRAAGLSGASAKPQEPLTGQTVIHALREREAYLDATLGTVPRQASMGSSMPPQLCAARRRHRDAVATPAFPRAAVARIGSAE